MHDIAIRLPDRPGALAELGEALGRAGISIEGGGGFAVDSGCLVHFLVGDGAAAEPVLRSHGFDVAGVRDVIAVRLAQAVPGQLGKLARAMADARVNIECVYSDHDHQLIVCVDDLEAGRRVAAAWSEDLVAATSPPTATTPEDLVAATSPPMEGIATATTPEDLAYVRADFATLEELGRGRAIALAEMRAWAGVRMPRASYAAPDGTLYYARDWWRLHDDAGGIDGVRACFERRYREAAAAGASTSDMRPGSGVRAAAIDGRATAASSAAVARLEAASLAADWDAYLAGLYGVCLRDATPENIVAKERLVDRLTRALDDARPADAAWCAQLRRDVDALDALLRPFASCDRARFGRPTSRERLVDGARRRFPQAFAR